MNSNIRQRNKSQNKYSITQKQKMSVNPIVQNYHSNNEFDNFQTTVSNITKQLNNISLGVFQKPNDISACLNEKDLSFLKNKNKDIFNISIDDKSDDNKYRTNISNSNDIIILSRTPLMTSRTNSFYIKATKYSNVNNENEIRQENLNLKENIKFLLGQIKKYQKSGIAIEECNKSIIVNNEIEISNRYKKLLNEKEEEINKINNNYQVELKSILEKVSNLEKEYNNLKAKYNDLKKKYNKEMEFKEKEKNKINYYINEGIKMNNSEILENNSMNNNFNLNEEYLFKNKNLNLNFENENSKNIENIENNNLSSKRFTFHRAYHTTDFANDYLIDNINKKKDNYDLSIDLKNDKKVQKRQKNEKIINLNKSFLEEREKNKIINYIYKEGNIPNTTKANNISFLYKKAPIKTEVVNSFTNMYQPPITKSISHNNLHLKSNYQKYRKFYKNTNISKEENYPKLIRKLSSTLYRKKNQNFSSQDNKKIYNNNSYSKIKNSEKGQLKEEEIKSYNNMNIPTPKGSYPSLRFPKIKYSSKRLMPDIHLPPLDLYHFPIVDNISHMKNRQNLNNIVYKFDMDKMKFSNLEYLLEKNSSFDLTYSSTINHFYDILLSISNGFLIITGANTDYLYYYNKNTNCIYDLCKLNHCHNKGSLLKINNGQIMCISGINSKEVEMYYIKDNFWADLPQMNCSHSESSYMIYNNNIVFSFFGYDYDNKRYITDIEFLLLKNYYEEKTWNKININENNDSSYTLRNHSIFYRINKENNNSTEIFIVGGYNNSGRNNGLIQVFIDDDDEMEFYIDFKKYEENKVKIKGNNNISLDKYNSMDNIFLFSNEFNQFFDEENNLFYSYNYDNNFNIHVIDNFTLKHTIYRNKLKK